MTGPHSCAAPDQPHDWTDWEVRQRCGRTCAPDFRAAVVARVDARLAEVAQEARARELCSCFKGLWPFTYDPDCIVHPDCEVSS